MKRIHEISSKTSKGGVKINQKCEFRNFFEELAQQHFPGAIF
jgi:hypothetical protein